MLKTLNGLIDFWIPANVRQDADMLLKGRMLVQSGLLVLPLMIFYAVFYVLVENYWGASYMFYGFVTALFMLMDFRKRGNFRFSGNFFCFTSYLIVSVFTLTTGGMVNMIVPWIIMVPISGFMLVGIRSGVFWSMASVLMVATLFILEFQAVPLPQFQSKDSMVYVNLFSLMGLIGYIVLVLLNNDFGRMQIVNDLRRVKADIEIKNEEITAINHSLEAVVATRTAKLQAANDELDTFLYESSHALRRPLVRIVGLLSLIESDLSAEEKASFMELISYTAHNMDAMLHDLLLVSEVYQCKLAPMELNLRHEVERILERKTDSKTRFTLEVPQQMAVRQDPEMLRIILQKLIDNAAFYQRDEGTHEVKVQAVQAGGKLKLTVSDNGIGIDKAALPHIFKMFSRGTERSKGSGLGLFIVQKALDRVGGRVEVESEKGKGTQVTVEM